MAYLPDFDFDIFVSHARVDNRTADARDGWVTMFLNHLKLELAQSFAGRSDMVELWWDKELAGNRLFDEAIERNIGRSAIFLALNSVGFLQSEYCQKEIRWFRESAERQRRSLKVGDASRIFNVLLHNLQPEEWPKEFKGCIGSPFHDAGESKAQGRPLSPTGEDFRRQMRKLSDDIAATLKQFKQAIAAAHPAPPPEPEPEKDVVFLAYTHDDLKERRAQVENELIRGNVTVINRLPPPYPAPQHEAQAIVELKRAHLSVHLLNDRRGKPIDEDESKTYPQRQVELALEHASAQLIWVPQSLEIKSIADETQRALLDRLENGERAKSDYRFIRESPSAITREILNHLEQLKQAAAPKPEDVATLLHTHPKDYPHASWLNQLLQNRQEPTLVSPRVDDPRLSLADLEERLRKTAKLIIVFGEAAEDWVRERLKHAVKFALTESCPLTRCAVFFAPPRSKNDGVRFDLGRLVQVDHFDLQDLLAPDTLANFLAKSEGEKR